MKAYEKLYNQSTKGENEGKYLNLEFAYLRDLATIDSLLRKKIFCIAADIEHYLKVSLLRDFNRSDEDGYEIVRVFREMDPDHFDSEIESKLKSSTCGDLIAKYKDNFAIWNIIEILSFKDFANLYALFYNRNSNLLKKNKPNYKGPYYYFIQPVRILRNAAAHSNCLLIKLSKEPNESFNLEYKVASFLGNKGIKNTALNKQLSKPLIHDFCVMLYLYSIIAPKEAQKHTFLDLKDLFSGRIVKNKHFYRTNSILFSAYDFTYKVINVFCNNLDIETS